MLRLCTAGHAWWCIGCRLFSDYLGSPVPFVIAVHKAVLGTFTEVMEEVVFVDLDFDQVRATA